MIDKCDLIFITFDKRNSTMQKFNDCDKNVLNYSIAKVQLHSIKKKNIACKTRSNLCSIIILMTISWYSYIQTCYLMRLTRKNQ